MERLHCMVGFGEGLHYLILFSEANITIYKTVKMLTCQGKTESNTSFVGRRLSSK